MITTRLAAGAAGRPTVVKQGAGAQAVERLRREADRLEAARHPGVVELLEWRDGDDGVELITAYAGPRTLADLLAEGLEPDRAAALVAQVAATLADVHGRGIVHGAVVPEHVIVGGEDRAVLCGWGGGPGDDGDGPGPADDVAAVGALLLAAADAADGTDDAWHLRALGQRAGAADPATRPSMRRIAADLAAVGGTDDEVDDDDARVEPGGPTSAGILRGRRPPAALAGARGRPLLLAAGVVAVLAMVALGAALVGGGDPAPPALAAPTAAGDDRAGDDAGRTTARAGTDPAGGTDTAGGIGPVAAGEGGAASGATPSAPPAPPAEQLWPPPADDATDGCAPTDGPAADVDGDTCPDALTVVDGTIEAGGDRWAVGEPGDVVLVGDWDCDGAASAGVVRPATGEVFLFTGWDEATVGPTQVVGGAVGATAVADSPGCDAVEVHDAVGPVTRVRG